MTLLVRQFHLGEGREERQEEGRWPAGFKDLANRGSSHLVWGLELRV
jgi:hypothetical protein